METNHRLKSVPPDEDDLIVVAHIVKVRGLRGEVVADLLTDFPDRFEELTVADRLNGRRNTSIFAN